MTDEVILMPGAGEVATAGERDLALSDGARALIAAGIPENTRKAYDRRWTAFVAWCESELRTPLPATEETLAEYVALTVTTPTTTGELPSPKSVEQAIAAIRTTHRRAGHPDQPVTTRALDILRGYRRETAARSEGAPPILIEELRAMAGNTSRYTTEGKRDRAVLVLGWAMAARRSELCALRLGDVAEVSEGVEVFVRTSKTDKRSEGHVVKIVAGGYPDTDPVRVLREWRAELAEYGVTDPSEPLFCSLDRWGNLRPSLSDRHVTAIVKRAAERAHLPHAARYSAHSLRAGFATQAARNRVPARVLADHGRWSPTSTVVNSYLRAVDDWQNNATRGIGL